MSAGSEYVSPAEDWYRGQYRQQQERFQERQEELEHGAALVSFPLAPADRHTRPSLLPHQQEYAHYAQSPTTQGQDLSLSSLEPPLLHTDDISYELLPQHSPSYFSPPFYDRQLLAPLHQEFATYDQQLDFPQEDYYSPSQDSAGSSALPTPYCDSSAQSGQFYDQQSHLLQQLVDNYADSRRGEYGEPQVYPDGAYGGKEDCLAVTAPDFVAPQHQVQPEQSYFPLVGSLADITDRQLSSAPRAAHSADPYQRPPSQFDSLVPTQSYPLPLLSPLDYSSYPPFPPYPTPYLPRDQSDPFALEIPLLVEELEFLARMQEQSPPEFANCQPSDALTSARSAPSSKPSAHATNFIIKLFHLLCHPDEFGDVIRWNPDGDAFLLAHSSEQLIKEILPTHFGHRNAIAFARQLAVYAFTRTPSGSEDPDRLDMGTINRHYDLAWYKHTLFHRDSSDQVLTRLRPKPSRARQEKQVESSRRLSLAAQLPAKPKSWTTAIAQLQAESTGKSTVESDILVVPDWMV